MTTSALPAQATGSTLAPFLHGVGSTGPKSSYRHSRLLKIQVQKEEEQNDECIGTTGFSAGRCRRYRGSRAKRLTKLSLVVSVGLLLAIPGVAQKNVNILTGVPINFASLTLHVGGNPINVYEFTVSIYPMNTPPPWPVGLWLYNYVEVDPDSPDNKVQSTWGQANWCRWWIYEVADLEVKTRNNFPIHISK